MRGFLANGNPTRLQSVTRSGSSPAPRTTLYGDIPIRVDVFLPVVVDISTHARVPLVGFGAFHIDDSVGGSGKYIQGHFVTGKILPYSSPGGPGYGSVSPPVLVQ